jgi:membrane protease YdiL (CAAX protease family)
MQVQTRPWQRKTGMEVDVGIAVDPVDRWLRWKVFGLLMLGALFGILGIMPYSLGMQGLWPPPQSLWLLIAIQLAENLLLFALATALGLWLGGKVGLGAPMLRAWLSGDREAPRAFRTALPLAVLLGTAAAIAIIALDIFVFSPLMPTSVQTSSGMQAPAAWQGLLASLYGGINEELMLRLGLMTLLVWIGAKLTRTNQPGAVVAWTANLLAAILFGLGHLPATAALVPLSAFWVIRAVVLNGLAGVAFGWLYWRKGILLAMVAHFSADIVLHVLTPLLVGLAGT